MKSLQMLFIAVAFTIAANLPADTIAYWQMQDGKAESFAKAGSDLKTTVNAPVLNAKVNKNKDLSVAFSADVPGKVIVSGQKVVNKNNKSSVKVTGKANPASAFSVANNKLVDQKSFTIEAFVKLEKMPTWTRIICKKRQKNHFSWILSIEKDSGKLRGRVDTNPFDAKNKTGFNLGMRTKTLIVDDKWHHIAGTYDGETKKFYIYIDYKIKSRATMPLPMIYDDQPLCFFATNYPGNIIAQIDEVRYSDKVLLPEDFLKVKK